MLRMLFGERPRRLTGRMAEVHREIMAFANLMDERIRAGKDRDHRLRMYEIGALGLLASLDELEQSLYAARGYANRITKHSLAHMSREEQLDYFRYVYFDKNGFIRVFAILDKLGAFLNDALGLETERMKPHFSYFTVLRNMRQRKLHPKLSAALDELKMKYQPQLTELRKRRNIEIHFMNTEMLDDLDHSRKAYGQPARLENIGEQVRHLEDAFEMITASLCIAFRYVRSRMK
ncbi:MAG: hypothetical protein A9Z00_07845 [Thermobacillus sp. ZCTH02-B1]|nr:MAG: hypothetical protein A9Z00_07845 [Thermobacillus sp. ZCTH02-B1]